MFCVCTADAEQMLRSTMCFSIYRLRKTRLPRVYSETVTRPTKISSIRSTTEENIGKNKRQILIVVDYILLTNSVVWAESRLHSGYSRLYEEHSIMRRFYSTKKMSRENSVTLNSSLCENCIA
ncbi:uncharacterized protein LOC143150711 [Ptiloglossa arizonensis]|uniref:uncharacterized protein LOC143150711 n=1 Tax=Ptiloglossa arizonensis TaxID=3350558 RepID=UPI003FA02100